MLALATAVEQTAPILIMETPRDFYTVHLPKPMTIEEIYQYLFVRFGRRCRVTLSENIARAIF